MITVGNLETSYQLMEESELQKAEAAAERAVKALERSKEVEHNRIRTPQKTLG